MKECRRCGEAKPLDLFPKDRRRPDGRFPYCKACHCGYQRQWGESNPERQQVRRQRSTAQTQAWRDANPEAYREQQRAYLLKHRYDITPEVYDQLLEHQGGGCALCGAKPETQLHGRLHIDHDHETGAVRGLLCFQHNVNLEWLAAAGRYLAEPPAEKCLS